MSRAIVPAIIVATVVAAAQVSPPPKERPVALVLKSSGAELRRANSALPLTAKPGDVLFAGDALLSGREASATFLYCPDSASEVLGPGAEVIFDPQQLRIKSGAIASKASVSICLLPELERSPVAGDQFYTSATTRELKGGPTGDLNSRIQALPENEKKTLLNDLEPIDKALSASPKDPALLIAKAAVLQKYNLTADAADLFRNVSDVLPDSVWTRQLVHVTPQTSPRRDTQAAAQTPDLAKGKTYALLVGISNYQKLLKEQFLHFADRDANTFYEHLQSGKGGSVPADNMVLLLNDQATTAKIRDNIHQFLKNRASINDTVVLFIAAHGIVSDTPDDQDAYIVTYDTDPQDLRSTALPMAEVKSVMDEDLQHVGRVLVFIDVCHAGSIGTIVDKKGNKVNAIVAQVLERKGQVFGMLASQPDQYSIEAPNFGGGHGAFTYFLLRGLNGDAENRSTGMIGPNDIFKYVLDKVVEATDSQQSPERTGFLSSDASLVDLDKEGIQLPPYTPFTKEKLAGLRRNRNIRALQVTGEPVPQRKVTRINRNLALLDAALDAGRVLPETPQNAFTSLQQLEKDLQPQEFAIEQGRVRSVLEDKAQQILLRYLEGDQIPQTRDDFLSGALYLEAAELLPPDSRVIESKKDFFRGRALIFDKKYQEAATALELAARLDPRGAYSYNALGIAYLEQANYERAKLAFRDATQRAPHWAYPWHNLALSYTETGDYDLAIRAYQEGMRLAPQYSYLPYNLGLVYQRLNRRDEARAAYNKAMALSPNLGEPYNALGLLSALSGHFAEAERLYRKALEKNPDLVAARHNLAVLLSGKPDRISEAIELWRANLAKEPEYLPSRLSLAEALGRQSNTVGAIAEYEAVVKYKPDYVAARRALAALLIREKSFGPALDQIKEALKRAPRDPDLNEQAGDVETGLNHTTEASAFYQVALQNAIDSKMRKRIRGKSKGVRERVAS